MKDKTITTFCDFICEVFVTIDTVRALEEMADTSRLREKAALLIVELENEKEEPKA